MRTLLPSSRLPRLAAGVCSLAATASLLAASACDAVTGSGGPGCAVVWGTDTNGVLPATSSGSEERAPVTSTREDSRFGSQKYKVRARYASLTVTLHVGEVVQLAPYGADFVDAEKCAAVPLLGADGVTFFTPSGEEVRSDVASDVVKMDKVPARTNATGLPADASVPLVYALTGVSEGVREYQVQYTGSRLLGDLSLTVKVVPRGADAGPDGSPDAGTPDSGPFRDGGTDADATVGDAGMGMDGTVGDGGTDADATVGDGGISSDGSASDGGTSPDGADGSGVGPVTGFAYAPTLDQHPVLGQWAVHSTGELTPLTPPNVILADANPSALAATPDGKFLYVTDALAGTLAQFAIGADGTVAPLSPATVGGGTEMPVAIAIHPTGRFAFVAKNGTDTVGTYEIGAVGSAGHGGLTFLRDTPVGRSPSSVAVTPDGTTLFVVNGASSSISTFTIDADGNLGTSRVTTETTASLPNQITVSAHGRNAYVTHGDPIDFKNSQFALVYREGQLHLPDGGVAPSDGGDVDGGTFDPPFWDLEPLSPPTVTAEDVGVRMVTNGTNTLAFGVNVGTSTISQYAIGVANGALTSLAPATVGVAVPTDGGPASLGDIALDPTGTFLYVADGANASLHTFRVAPAGLTQIAGGTVAAFPGTGRLLVVPKP